MTDRELGEYWERNFCRLVARYNNRLFTAHQVGRSSAAAAYKYDENKIRQIMLLPDITLWSCPGEHHEVKHKEATRTGWYGLEVYRLHALLDFQNETNQDVLYTIHDHGLAGGKWSKVNDIDHWKTIAVENLIGRQSLLKRGPSLVRGEMRENIPTLYWETALWTPLADWWRK